MNLSLFLETLYQDWPGGRRCFATHLAHGPEYIDPELKKSLRTRGAPLERTNPNGGGHPERMPPATRASESCPPRYAETRPVSEHRAPFGTWLQHCR